MNGTLYDKYGGQATVDALVVKFYDGVLKNDTIKQFFSSTDMDKQRAKQANFVAMALGGPNPYTGKSMREAHKNMGLTDEHFDAVVDELTDAMDSLGVTEADIQTVIATVEGQRIDVLNQ